MICFYYKATQFIKEKTFVHLGLNFFSRFFIGLILCYPTILQAQDLPPATANLELISAGSYIIPMDKSKQSINQTNALLDLEFEGLNLAAYGLAYEFLANDIPIKWVIKAGKDKDEADFTAQAKQLFPIEGPVMMHDFISSAFIVQTSSCFPGLTASEQLNEIISNFGSEVAVYELVENVEVDVRYQLNYPPQIAVLNDGPAIEIHTDVLDDARIPYTEIGINAFFSDYSCYTFISQPHLDSIAEPNYVSFVTDFVNNGGNFFTQCFTIKEFENAGHFHSTGGIYNPDIPNTDYTYLNHDMPIMQFEGELSPGLHGLLDEFVLGSSSVWQPTTYIALLNQEDQVLISSGDLNGATLGGNIIYLTGHEFEGTDIPSLASQTNPPYPPEIVDELSYNQQHKRVYLNSAFIPANVAFACAGNDACICLGESVTLGCEELTSTINYTWTPPDGLTCTNCPNPEASPTETTTYTMTTDNGCSASTVTVTVDNVIPEVLISGNEDLPCNVGSSVNLLVEFLAGNPPFQFAYAFDGNTIDTITTSENSYALNVDQVGDYTITSFLATGYCSQNIIGGTATVTKNGSLTRSDLPITELICADAATLLDANYGAGAVYLWNNGSTTPSITVNEAGTYWVNILLNDCETTDSVVVSSANALNVPTLPSSYNACQSEGLSIDVTSSGAIDYTWSTGLTEPVIDLTQTDIYSVSISNGCEEETEIRSFDVVFEPIDETEIFTVVTAFSPNQDGINDVFKPFLNLRVELLDYEIQIYDRWGKQLVKSTDIEVGWDGTDGGADLEMGVYVWMIKARVNNCAAEVNVVDKGAVTLIR